MYNLLYKKTNYYFVKYIYCFVFIIVALDVFIAYGVDGLSKDNDRQTKSYKNETLSGEEYYEAGLKGELMDPESKREPLLLSDLKLVRGKPSGVTEGGVYKDVNGGTWIVKQAQRPVNEYLGSKVMDLLIGPLSPEVRLLADAPDYTASKLLPGFLTKEEVMNDPNHKPIIGDDKLSVAMDLMGLGDRHDENLGYIDMGDRLEAARVDFDDAFQFDGFRGYADSKVLESIIGIPDEMILYVLGDAYNDLWEFGTSLMLNYKDYKNLGAQLIERKHSLKDRLSKMLEYERLYDKAKNDPLNYTKEEYEQFKQLIADLYIIRYPAALKLYPMLAWSVGIGEPNIVRLFLKNWEGDINNPKDKAFIHEMFFSAISDGHIDIVRLLLDNGADVNFRIPGRNRTMLSLAALKGYLDVVRLLLDNGADVNIKNIDGMTALDSAKAKGFTEIVSLLEEKISQGQ